MSRRRIGQEAFGFASDNKSASTLEPDRKRVE